MLKKTHVDKVLIQADYQSGDRYGIASALKADKKLGILILHAEGKPGQANDMRSLYSGVENAANRIELVACPPRVKKNQDAAAFGVKVVYWGGTHEDIIEKKMVSKRSALLRQHVEDAVELQRVTFGTQVIAELFGDDTTAGTARRALQAFWAAEDPDAIKDWLARKGFDPNKRYVFLFAKKGKPTAEKAHHFTSILTWRLIIDRIKRETDVIPVLAGDNIGLTSTPSLVEFWDDRSWKDIFNGNPTRRDQLGLWCYFASVYGSCSILGMRSGAIEVPALLGVRTLYLEERGNKQAERMMQWLGSVDTWNRQILKRPPGIRQQQYWAGYKHTAGPAEAEKASIDSIRKKVTVVFATQEQMSNAERLGSDLAGLSPMKQTLTAHKDVNAQQFVIEEKELDDIVEWIKQAPEARIAVRSTAPMARSAASAQRSHEESMRAMSAAKGIKTWTEYFSSAAYVSSLPAISET